MLHLMRPSARLRARTASAEIVGALVAAVGRSGARARNKRGLTPLGEAVAAGRADVAKLLGTEVRPGYITLGLRGYPKGVFRVAEPGTS